MFSSSQDISFPFEFLTLSTIEYKIFLSILKSYSFNITTLAHMCSSKKFNLVPKNSNLVSKKINLVRKSFNLVSKKFNLVPKKFNSVPKNFNLVSKNFNLVPENHVFSHIYPADEFFLMEIRTWDQSKISSSSFFVWCKSKQLGGRGGGGSRFPLECI